MPYFNEAKIRVLRGKNKSQHFTLRAFLPFAGKIKLISLFLKDII